MISKSKQASEFVIQSCEKTLYKDLCISALGSAPATTKDLQSLTNYGLDLVSSEGAELLQRCNELLKTASDQKVKQKLTDCSQTYQTEIDELKESRVAADTESYNDVHTRVAAAMNAAEWCEEGFKETPATQSPLTAENTRFSQLCSVLLTFCKLLVLPPKE
ncbi:hypothetical protein JCGZ_23289 [Jatropha curcas]|uniref:Pectinesterase inhibitor domain-containing protein n=2 Tax=Jatropha curcas TaxID=180498 RepID=A0A067JHN2_JATCU|nr:hypothetical protein JCGZ_23289 [Jatropha curcas]